MTQTQTFNVNNQALRALNAIKEAAEKEECGIIKANELLEKVPKSVVLETWAGINAYPAGTDTRKAFDALIKPTTGQAIEQDINKLIIENIQDSLAENTNILKELASTEVPTDDQLLTFQNALSTLSSTDSIVGALVTLAEEHKQERIIKALGNGLGKAKTAKSVYRIHGGDGAKPPKTSLILDNQKGLKLKYHQVADKFLSLEEALERAKQIKDFYNQFPKDYPDTGDIFVIGRDGEWFIQKSSIKEATAITNKVMALADGVKNGTKKAKLPIRKPSWTDWVRQQLWDPFSEKAHTLFAKANKQLPIPLLKLDKNELIKAAEAIKNSDFFDAASTGLSTSSAALGIFDLLDRASKTDKDQADYLGILITLGTTAVGVIGAGSVLGTGVIAATPAFAFASITAGLAGMGLMAAENADSIIQGYEWMEETLKGKTTEFTITTSECSETPSVDPPTTKSYSIFSDLLQKDQDQIRLLQRIEAGGGLLNGQEVTTGENGSIQYFGTTTSEYNDDILYNDGGSSFFVSDRISLFSSKSGPGLNLTGTYTMSDGIIEKSTSINLRPGEAETIVTLGPFNATNKQFDTYGENMGYIPIDFTIEINEPNKLSDVLYTGMLGHHGTFYKGTVDAVFI